MQLCLHVIYLQSTEPSSAKSWLIKTETTRHKTSSSSSSLQKDTQQRIALITPLGRSAAPKQRRKETEASLKDGKSVYHNDMCNIKK
ncbi:unnamed protein product [Linum tenue]|uniref:Uncharacterized protein n=1 Tax=Linum tenue TaxID=586396 RepID=A0AAV0GP18_9ROSI|nr:unnamed protein product [Linum tenue]